MQDRYDVFLSYSRGADRNLAAALQSELQRFGRPWWHRGRVLRVFRDETSLAAAATLEGSIVRALEASDWFVLMASPGSAGAPWVGVEVAWWLRHRGTDRMLLAYTDGTILWSGDDFHGDTDAIPPELYGRFPTQPLWVDLREFRPAEVAPDGARPRIRLGDVVAGFAAPIQGRDKDELVGEHIAQQRKAALLTRVVITVLSVLLIGAVLATGVAVVQTRQARQETARANRQARSASARQLMAQADAVAGQNPRLGLRLNLSAYGLAPGSETRSALVAQLARTSYAGTLTGHEGSVDALAFSPDGRLLASAGADLVVRVWDMTSADGPRLLGAPLDEHTLAVDSLAFSPDGRLLAAGSPDGTVVLWSMDGRGRSTRLTVEGDKVGAVSFAPDGTTLVAVASGGRPVLWDVTSSGPPQRRAVPAALERTPVSSITFSPAGSLAALTDADGGVALWRFRGVDDPVPVGAVLAGNNFRPVDVTFSPSGRLLAASGDVNDTVVLWDVADPGRPARRGEFQLPRFDGGRRIAISTDGAILASASFDGAVTLWDISDPNKPERLGAPLTGHSASTNAVAFSPDGHTLASAGADTTVMLWNIEPPNRPRWVGTPPGTRYAIGSVAYDATGGTLAAGDEWRVLLWSTSNRPMGAPVVLESDAAQVTSVTFTAGDVVAAADEGGAVVLWDAAAQRRLGRWVVCADRTADSLAYLRDRALLAVGCEEGLVVVLDLADPASPAEAGRFTTGSAGAVRSVAFATVRATLAAGSTDGTVTLWDVTSPAHATRIGSPLAAHTDGVSGVTFSPDGTRLASASLDQTVIVWDVADPARPRPVSGAPLTGHTGRVWSVAFSPDGRTVASGGDDGVRFWLLSESGTVRQLGTPPSRRGSVMALAYSPHGTALAASAGSLTVWDVSPFTAAYDRAVEVACRAARGGLSRADWQRMVPDIAYVDACV